ncbi:hypothetical protein ACF09J_34500 [Streptomyces sp. NPDC014889]|uniref:hypothetical protein n=1 Tax=Streptomyces sp. NPDC014889 TaxID=3364928 RepID=UPI0037018292
MAAFLGVRGSVMTGPAMRRAGQTMQVAVALANPLTLAIALPAAAVYLCTSATPVIAHVQAHLAGTVDLRAAAALLIGALPVIAVLRRRPPRIADRTHARAYAALLARSRTARPCARRPQRSASARRVRLKIPLPVPQG